MKKLICILSICSVLTACGNSPSNENGTDTTTTTVGPDTTIRDTGTMMMDTTHRDTGVVH